MNKELFELLLQGFHEISNVYKSYSEQERKKIDDCLLSNRYAEVTDLFHGQPTLELEFTMKTKSIEQAIDAFTNTHRFNELFQKKNTTLIVEVGLLMDTRDSQLSDMEHFSHRNVVVIRRENNNLYLIYIEPHGVFLENEFFANIRKKRRWVKEIIDEYGFDPLDYIQENLPDLEEDFVFDVQNTAFNYIKSLYIRNQEEVEQIKDEELKQFVRFMIKAMINESDFLSKIEYYLSLQKKNLYIQKFIQIQREVIPFLLKGFKIEYQKGIEKYEVNGQEMNIFIQNKEYPIQDGDTKGFCTTISMISHFIDILLSECVNNICYKEIKYEGSLYVDLFFQLLEQFVYREKQDSPVFSMCVDKNNYMCVFNIFYTILTINEMEQPQCSYLKSVLNKKAGSKMMAFYEIVNETINNIRELVFTKLPKKVQKKITRELYEDLLNEMY